MPIGIAVLNESGSGDPSYKTKPTTFMHYSRYRLPYGGISHILAP